MPGRRRNRGPRHRVSRSAALLAAGTLAVVLPPRVGAVFTRHVDGAWHQVAATLDAGAGTALYVDGVAVAADASVRRAYVYPADGHWRLGYDDVYSWPEFSGRRQFLGTLDVVAVHHRALSTREVAAHYRRGSA